MSKKKDSLKFGDLDDILGKDFGGDFNDPYEILFEEDDGKKKKKKKDKAKKKDKDKGIDMESYKESLKALSKKELRKKCDDMGVDLDYIDQEDKKAMRKAIMKARKDQETGKKIRGSKDEDDVPASLLVETDMKKAQIPYYFDTETRDFVITKADDAEDMQVLNAMRSLGNIRKKKRSKDGFGSLMDAIMKKLEDGTFDQKALSETDTKKATAIDVDYTEVKEEPKVEEKPKEELSSDVKDALDDLSGKKAKKN